MGVVLSVNLAVPRANPAKESVGTTGIDKQPTSQAVSIRAPGPKGTGPDGGLGSGLVGDQIFDRQHHGGDDQAVYAYAREDLDYWEALLDRRLPGGVFGENLTTHDVDVTGALIGERWRVGDQVVLEVALPRIPCATFAYWLAERGWVKRFTSAARPGAYLRVITPGPVSADDAITIDNRPDHDVTIGVVFRALTDEPKLLPRLLDADALPLPLRERASTRIRKESH